MPRLAAPRWRLIALAGGALLLAAGLALRSSLAELPQGTARTGSTATTGSAATRTTAAESPAPQPALPSLPSDPALPRAADGRHYPLVPADPAALAALLASVEAALRSEDTPADALPTLGHQQQVIYRVLSRRPAQAEAVRRALPERWRRPFDLHLTARRAFLAMHRGHPGIALLPAWRIVPPEPAATLLAHYRKAEAATGIPWQVLAAVNLVESGMGRIDGVSVADARGPMQFLPTTWAQPGVGRGDIRDPHDAIQAAARYLVRRGGLRDIRRGLWGYNNSDHYGRAVLAYAALLRDDPRAYTGLYHWEIHVATTAGDLWLPVGYAQSRPIPVGTWLQRLPASAAPLANGPRPVIHAQRKGPG